MLQINQVYAYQHHGRNNTTIEKWYEITRFYGKDAIMQPIHSHEFQLQNSFDKQAFKINKEDLLQAIENGDYTLVNLDHEAEKQYFKSHPELNP